MGRGQGADDILYGKRSLAEASSEGSVPEDVLQGRAEEILLKEGRSSTKRSAKKILSMGKKVELETEGEVWQVALAIVVAEKDGSAVFRGDLLQWGPDDKEPSHASFYDSADLKQTWKCCRERSEELFSTLEERPSYNASWSELGKSITALWMELK